MFLQGHAEQLRKIASEVGSELEAESQAAGLLRILSRTIRKMALDSDYSQADYCSMLCRIGSALGKLEYFESRAWVPGCLREAGTVGDDIDGLGSLWYNVQRPKSLRWGHESFVFDLMGRLLIGLDQCDVIVLSWLAKVSLDLGIPSQETVTFMDSVSATQWRDWIKTVDHCRLTAGAIAWIPYGSSCAVIGLEPDTDDTEKAIPLSGASAMGGSATPQYWSSFLTMSLVSRSLYDHLSTNDRSILARQHMFPVHYG